MSKHTPGPWERLPGFTMPGHPDGANRLVLRVVRKRKPDETAFEMVALVDSDKAEANAEFIVRACNSHGDLVAALDSIRNDLDAADSTNFGDLGKLLDRMVVTADKALDRARGRS